ncbi:MAG: four helix bundle protein [Tepidisphaeraceae bacterium]|jgi:hypothetical protein
MAFAFEKLQVYQKAVSFADAVCTITRDLPRGYFFLGDQLSRAAFSIAANIAAICQPLPVRDALTAGCLVVKAADRRLRCYSTLPYTLAPGPNFVR